MRGNRIEILMILILALVSAGLASLRPEIASVAADETSAAQMQMEMSIPSDQGIPSYHAYALKPPYPKTLDPKQFPDAINRNVYAMAAKIKPVLYQQPCYCYCDRNVGHKSLLDCYASSHGSQCDICQKEAILAYQMTQKGKTPNQIRDVIIRGDWKSVDERPYMTAAPPR